MTGPGGPPPPIADIPGVTDRTIPMLIAEAAERDPDGAWLRTGERTLSFGAAAGWVAATVERVRDAGIARGDLVVLVARNAAPDLLTLLALCAAGAVAVPVNPAGTPHEIAGLVEQTRPRALISAASAREAVEGAVAAVSTAPDVIDVDELTGEGPPAAAGAALTAAAVRPGDPAVLIATSGTTGRSKLVTQTHRAYAMAGEGFPFWLGLNRDDVLMTSLPLFHINAQAYSTMGSLACGAGLALLPRFSASGFLDAARRHRATEFNAIGAMLEILMRQPERPDDADTPLRICYTGPSPARERQEEIERRFGLELVCGYGMSESPYGLIWPRGERPFGTMGRVRQHPRGRVGEARVVDATGTDVAAGEAGELLLRNPTVTPGYWGMPEETARTVVDGWLHTGDLVRADPEGTITFVSRIKEVIRRRGENLAPQEVEEAVAAHAAVLECAVVAVPSELSEDEVKAFVVLREGAAVEVAELRDHAAARLAAFKVPRFWQLLPELPRTPTGRVAKHRLPQGHPAEEVDLAPAGRPSAAEEAP